MHSDSSHTTRVIESSHSISSRVESSSLESSRVLESPKVESSPRVTKSRVESSRVESFRVESLQVCQMVSAWCHEDSPIKSRLARTPDFQINWKLLVLNFGCLKIAKVWNTELNLDRSLSLDRNNNIHYGAATIKVRAIHLSLNGETSARVTK